jgi:hypothetical protein
MFPDEPTDEERLEEMPEDNGTPFRPADDSGLDDTVPADDSNAQADATTLDDTHPVTDTNIDPQEEYDEGVAGAAEANEPNPGNNVVGYDKPDQPTPNPS